MWVGPKSEDQCPYKKREHREDGHVKTWAETGMMQLQAREAKRFQEPQPGTGMEEGIAPAHPKGTNPSNTWISHSSL